MDTVRDTRFWTVCDELDELVSTVDIDGIGDIETLLMFLFARPVGVDYAWNEDVEFADLEITVTGNDQQGVSIQKFPVSVVQLVRSCAETVADLGHCVDDVDARAEESPDVLKLSDEALTTVLQQALGQVRLFKLIYPDEETLVDLGPAGGSVIDVSFTQPFLSGREVGTADEEARGLDGAPGLP